MFLQTLKIQTSRLSSSRSAQLVGFLVFLCYVLALEVDVFKIERDFVFSFNGRPFCKQNTLTVMNKWFVYTSLSWIQESTFAVALP